MKNSLRIHKWTHNEFNIFILGVLTHPHSQYHGVVLAVPSRDDFLVLSARMRKIMLNYRRAKNSVFIFYLFLYKISCISAKIQASLIFCVRFALYLQPKTN